MSLWDDIMNLQAGVGMTGPSIGDALYAIGQGLGAVKGPADQFLVAALDKNANPDDIANALASLFSGAGGILHGAGPAGSAATGEPTGAAPGATSTQQQAINDLLSKLGLTAGGTAAGAAGAAAAPDGYYTPDGHFILNNSPDDRFYRMADSIWTKIYGGHPPFSAVDAMRKSGVQNADQLTAAINGMPSHIPGVTIGEYEGTNASLQKVATQLLGRPMPDSMVRQLFKEGMTTPSQISLWFANHAISEIPKDDFHQIWDLANNWTQGAWGTNPHPDQIAAIHAQLQANATAAAGTTTPAPQPVPPKLSAPVGGAQGAHVL